LVSMIVLAVISSLAVSICSFSGMNVQLAGNQRKTNQARFCAESGLEVMRYWLSGISIPGDIAPDQRFNYIADSLRNELSSAGISNISVSYSGSDIAVPAVVLDSAASRHFSAEILPLDTNTVQVNVTGSYASLTRSIRVNYQYSERANTAFDFGVATRGPLSLKGNIELEGVNIDVESDVYIESPNSLLALSIIGNSRIAGDVHIASPDAYVDLQGGQAGIGGETGQAAVDNHVSFGVLPTEFPEPCPSRRRQ